MRHHNWLFRPTVTNREPHVIPSKILHSSPRKRRSRLAEVMVLRTGFPLPLARPQFWQNETKKLGNFSARHIPCTAVHVGATVNAAIHGLMTKGFMTQALP